MMLRNLAYLAIRLENIDNKVSIMYCLYVLMMCPAECMTEHVPMQLQLI